MQQRKPSGFIHLTGIQHSPQHHNSVFGQPISHSIGTWSSIPCTNETYRYMISFHTLDHRRRKTMAHLLPYWRDGHRCIHKGTSLTKGEAFCSWTWTLHRLRRSVGFQTGFEVPGTICKLALTSLHTFANGHQFSYIFMWYSISYTDFPFISCLLPVVLSLDFR